MKTVSASKQMVFGWIHYKLGIWSTFNQQWHIHSDEQAILDIATAFQMIICIKIASIKVSTFKLKQYY